MRSNFARLLIGGALALLSAVPALAQSSPGLTYGQVPTAAQWNSYFAAKQDVLRYTPVNKAGDAMLGQLIMAPGSTTAASMNIPQGVPPSTPNNGDVWTTSAGLFVRAGGVTYGPITGVVNCASLPALTGDVTTPGASCATTLNTVPINKGGTNATTAASARANLGLAIGSNVEAWSANLDTLASPASGGFPYWNGSAWAQTAYDSVGSTAMIGNGSGGMTHLAFNPTAGCSSNTFVYALTNTLSASCRQVDLTLMVTGALPIANGGTNATSAGAARTNLGLAIGTNVEAWASTLDVLANPTPTLGSGFLPYWNGTAYAAWSVDAVGSTAIVSNGGSGYTHLAFNPTAGCAANTYMATLTNTLSATCSKIDLTASVLNALPIANGGTGQTSASAALAALAGAPLSSPTFTGTPAAPTAAPGTNTTQLATTAFVAAAVAGGPVTSVFTRTGAVVAASGDYTVAQITGAAPLASPTFTGTINGAAEILSGNLQALTLSVGGVNSLAQDEFFGTYSANPQFMYLHPVLTNTTTGTQQAFYALPVFNPGGASISTVYGALIRPRMSGSSSLNVGTFAGIDVLIDTLSGYSGTIANGYDIRADDVSQAGTNPVTTFSEFFGVASANGTGNTSGTITNSGVRINAHTAAPALGGTINNIGGYFTVGSGSGAGTAINRGVYITGNGGSGGSGSTSNYGLYDDSTANNVLVGNVRIGGTTNPVATLDVTGTIAATSNINVGNTAAFFWSTRSIIASPADGKVALSNNAQTDFTALQFGGTSSSFPEIKRSTTTLAIRLADDSADASLTALTQSSSDNSTFVATTAFVKAQAYLSGTVPIANGGTNATTAASARTNLGLAIGTNVEAWSAILDTLAAPPSGGLPYWNGSGYSWTAYDSVGSTVMIGNGGGGMTHLAFNPTAGCGSNTYVSALTNTLSATCSKIDLTASVLNALPIANGGTGQTTALAALNALGDNPFTAPSDSSTSSTTLTNPIANLSPTVLSGKTYNFKIIIQFNADATSGIKVGLSTLSATTTWFIGTIVVTCTTGTASATSARVTALGQSLSVTGCTQGQATIDGSMSVNSGAQIGPGIGITTGASAATLKQGTTAQYWQTN